MKKLLRRLSFFKYSAFVLAAIVPLGCSTEHYYDSNTTPDASPRQATAAQTAFDNYNNGETVDSDSSSPPPPTILRQGDTIKVTFPGSQNLDETEQIRLDGKIALPLVGDVQAAGVTPDQLQENLIKLYQPQISSSDVTVAIVTSSFPVFVTGCVLSPGKISSNQPITALEAVMEAGGFDYARANLRRVHVVRRDNGSSTSYILDLKSVLKGDSKNDFYLRPDDIIYVPEKFSWF
jgi:polysaccharide biosynthesis/export protein